MELMSRTCSLLVFSALMGAGQTSEKAPAVPAGPPPTHSLAFLQQGEAFVSIPAGEFTMGSASGNADEAPPHRVRLTKGFEIAKYEVTQAQWKAVMDSPHSKAKGVEKDAVVEPSHFKGPSLPVENVSWESVQTFLRTLNSRDEKYEYRLPTEAEWEYAAAGQSQEASSERNQNAWCASEAGKRTHPIGEKPPNARGLYDMLGNVMEWVQDWYAPDYYETGARVDPRGPASGSYRVYRGGAWLSSDKQCRPSYRGFDFPNAGYYSVGFRLVRTAR